MAAASLQQHNSNDILPSTNVGGRKVQFDTSVSSYLITANLQTITPNSNKISLNQQCVAKSNKESKTFGKMGMSGAFPFKMVVSGINEDRAKSLEVRLRSKYLYFGGNTSYSWLWVAPFENKLNLFSHYGTICARIDQNSNFQTKSTFELSDVSWHSNVTKTDTALRVPQGNIAITHSKPFCFGVLATLTK